MKPIERAKILKEYQDEGFSNKEIATRFFFEHEKRLSKGVISTDLKIMSDDYSFLSERIELGIISYKVGKMLVFLKYEDSVHYLHEYLKNKWSISKLEQVIKEKNIKRIDWDIEKNAEELIFKTKRVKAEIGNKKIIIKYRTIKDLTEIFKKLDIREE